MLGSVAIQTLGIPIHARFAPDRMKMRTFDGCAVCEHDLFDLLLQFLNVQGDGRIAQGELGFHVREYDLDFWRDQFVACRLVIYACHVARGHTCPGGTAGARVTSLSSSSRIRISSSVIAWLLARWNFALFVPRA